MTRTRAVSHKYSTAQKLLHWATVLLLVSQRWTSRAVLRTLEMHGLVHKIDPFALVFHTLHIYCGVLIFAFVAIRLALRFRIGAPPLPVTVPRWSARSAKAAYFLIYATLIGLTLTELVTSYLWFGIAIAHQPLVYGLCALITLHVSAVNWHDTSHRTGLLSRMKIARDQLDDVAGDQLFGGQRLAFAIAADCRLDRHGPAQRFNRSLRAHFLKEIQRHAEHDNGDDGRGIG